jgi:dTDP-4-dehydrorhamnose 3,5-epimerase
MKEHPLPGVRTSEINLMPDERGFFGEVLRQDWKDLIDEWIVQTNMSYSYPGMIRAWHRHDRGQIDYFLVLKGAAKICAYDEKTGRLAEIISSSHKPSITRIPGFYMHGFKAISNEPTLIVYFVNRIYDYKNPDEVRKPWNDPEIVPTEINGNKNDIRIGKPWDWNYPPHK